MTTALRPMPDHGRFARRSYRKTPDRKAARSGDPMPSIPAMMGAKCFSFDQAVNAVTRTCRQSPSMPAFARSSALSARPVRTLSWEDDVPIAVENCWHGRGVLRTSWQTTRHRPRASSILRVARMQRRQMDLYCSGLGFPGFEGHFPRRHHHGWQPCVAPASRIRALPA